MFRGVLLCVMATAVLSVRAAGPEAPDVHGTTRAAGRPSPDVVVWLDAPNAPAGLQRGKVVLDQRNITFTPHVLAVRVGTLVDFPNDDPIFHNVFSLSSAATFDLRRYPKGQSRSQQFTKAGIVKVYCNIHSHMSATILVLDHPYFTVPELDGTFELPNVPAGQYTIVGWHERVGERRIDVKVERGKATAVKISLPVEDPQ